LADEWKATGFCLHTFADTQKSRLLKETLPKSSRNLVE